MPTIPVIPASVLADAKSIWKQAIEKFGRSVTFYDASGASLGTVKAFCKRPKILGLFDRTEQSFDQERYMVLVDADDFGSEPEKFYSARWNSEDHAVLSVTEVDLQGTVFGYRVLVKG